MKKTGGVENSLSRPYTLGDELKFIDWKVYARRDKFFVKQFQEDVALETCLLVDASGSMAYQGLGPTTKWDYACRLAVGLAYLVLNQGDAVGLATFQTAPSTFLPPRRQLTHLDLIDRTLAEMQPSGETDLSASLRRVALRLSRRSFVVLISDLLGDPLRVLEIVKALRAKKHEVFVLQVLDPMERDLALDGPVLFESLENQPELRVEASLIRRAYREEFDRLMRVYHGGFHQSGVPYFYSYTDAPWDNSLGGFLARCRGS